MIISAHYTSWQRRGYKYKPKSVGPISVRTPDSRFAEEGQILGLCWAFGSF